MIHPIPPYRWAPLLAMELEAWTQHSREKAQRPDGLFLTFYDALAMAAARVHNNQPLQDIKPFLLAASELALAGFRLSEGYIGEALEERFDDPICIGQHATIENWLTAWCLAAILHDRPMQVRLIDRPLSRFSPWGPDFLKPLHAYLWSVTMRDEACLELEELEDDPAFHRFALWPQLFAQLTGSKNLKIFTDSLNRHADFAKGRTTRTELRHTVAWVETGLLVQLGVSGTVLEHPYAPSVLRT